MRLDELNKMHTRMFIELAAAIAAASLGAAPPKPPVGPGQGFRYGGWGLRPQKLRLCREAAQGQVALGQNLGAVSPCADIYFSLHLSILLSHLCCYAAQV